MGIEIGKRGIMAHQRAMDVTGHNMANVNRPDFSRQRVDLGASEPLFTPSFNRASSAGQVGQGAEVDGIVRLRALFLDRQINDENHSFGRWETRRDFLNGIEVLYNEPFENNLRTILNDFWSAWEDLADDPAATGVGGTTGQSARIVVAAKGQELAEKIQGFSRQLLGLQEDLNLEIEAKVEEVNSLINRLVDLNVLIRQSEGLGDNPNDLLDRRDKIVTDLSKVINIEARKTEAGQFMVTLGGRLLVQGEEGVQLFTKRDVSTRIAKIYWDKNASDEVIQINNGQLRGALDVINNDLQDHKDQLNEFAANLIDRVNGMHRNGFDNNGNQGGDFFLPFQTDANIQGFFRINGNISVGGDTKASFDSLNINAADVTIGSQNISVAGTDSLSDLVMKINDQAGTTGVVANISSNNTLTLRATAAISYTLPSISGLDFVGIDPGTGSVGVPKSEGVALRMSVSSAVTNDTNLIVAAGGDPGGSPPFSVSAGPGNNKAALDMSGIAENGSIMSKGNSSLDGYFASVVAQVGTQKGEAGRAAENQSLLLSSLEVQRQSVMGVSLDEEMTNMVKFQHGYTASARVISTMDEMIQTVLNLKR